MKVYRVIAIACSALLVGTVLADPYTFHATASDYVVPAAWWQTALALADVALLIAVGALLWRKRDQTAFWVTGAEVLYALTLGIAFVVRDGVNRFVEGIGAEQYLSLYFGFIMLRVVLLLLTHALATTSLSAAT